MKILLSAFSCGATNTSEPGNAWRIVNQALEAGHEVWTITEGDGYEPALKAYLAEHPMPNYHPVFFTLPKLLKLRRSRALGAIYYHLWQGELARFARRLHQEIGFDLAHHVTFGRYWSPSGVRDIGIPFLWGPVGAADSTPPAFLPELSFRDRMFEFVRDGIRNISHLDPALRDTAKKSTVGIGITRGACDVIRKLGTQRVAQLPCGVLTEEELATFDQFPPPPAGPFRAICIGRLLHWKGFYLAIRAFAAFARANPQAELWIVGGGPALKSLEKTAADSGLGSRIRFWGHLSHDEAMKKLAQVHVMMHPALHDNFPGVCLEAMAAGRPVVCLDVGGPAIQVTPESGFIAPVDSPENAVQAMAAFLTRMAESPEQLAAMAAKARLRVREEFTAKKLGTALNALWNEAKATGVKS